MVLYQVRFERAIAINIVSAEPCRRVFYLSTLRCNIPVFYKRIAISLVDREGMLSFHGYVGFKYTMLASEEYPTLHPDDNDEVEFF